MKKIVVAGAALAACAFAVAKLPPLDDAAKAKAAETAAKAAWQAKVDTFQLCKVQDKIAAAYAKGGGKGAQLTPVVAKPAAAASAAQPAAAAAAASAAVSAKAAASAASAPATTPVASSAPPPCADPGPFAYNPPEQKPLETAGAHSPTGTAASPPSVRPEAAQMTPGSSAPASAKK